MYRRILIKLSGEALAGDKHTGFCDKTIGQIAEDIKGLVDKNIQVSLVIGGGNFWRGRSANIEMDRTVADEIGMLATVMNGLYFSDALRQKGLKTSVMTPFKVSTFSLEFSKNSALDILNDGGVCIFVGGIGHPFFSTDTITTLRALELDCDLILYAKSIDGIYDKDPNIYPDAKKYSEITYDEIIAKNLGAIDISAINLCNTHKIESLVFALKGESSISNALFNVENNSTKIKYN